MEALGLAMVPRPGGGDGRDGEEADHLGEGCPLGLPLMASVACGRSRECR